MVISVLATKMGKKLLLIIFIRDDLKLFREIIVVCIRTRIRLYVGFAKAGCFFEQNPTGILEKLSFPWRKTWQNQDNDRKNSHRSSWKIPRGETRWFWNFSWTPIRIPSVILCLPRRKHERIRTMIEKKYLMSSWRIPTGETRWLWNSSRTPIRIPLLLMCFTLKKNITDNDPKKFS